MCTKFHSNPYKDVGGVEKTIFNGTEGRNDGRTDKANTKCPLAILWQGHKNIVCLLVDLDNIINENMINIDSISLSENM